MALPMTALGAVTPGLILMSPEFDQFYGTLTAGLFYIELRGLDAREHHGWWGLNTGVLFAFCLYWSFGLFVLAIPLVLVAIAAIRGVLGKCPENSEVATIHLPFRSAIYWLLGLGLGTVIPWLLLWWFGGFQLLSVLNAAIRDAHVHGVIPLRPYVLWLFFNLFGFFQFVGLPMILVTILMLFWPELTSEPARATRKLLTPQYSLFRAYLPT